MSNDGEVREHMKRANGARSYSFTFDGCNVLVDGLSEEDNERVRLAAGALHSGAVELERVRAVVRELRALIPPKTATRLLTAGCVRERDAKVWLMNKRESGWASFAFCMGTWDNLFRHYDVEVYEAGVDESGGYWMVRNREAQP